MLNTVKDYIEKHQIIENKDRVVLAVSGGPDSMALLHLLIQIQQEWGIKIAAAHLNHQLRPAAAAELQYLQSYCAAQKIDFYSRVVDVAAYARREKKSIEEAGRDQRYQFLRELCQQIGYNKVATAHHRDDRAETVLMHLLRGSGIKGLRSIMPVSGSLVRPLLIVGKSDILAYLDENAIKYCHDASNYELQYFRNRIRLELLPLLQEYNPQIFTALNQLADIAAAEDQVLEKETEALWEQLIIREQTDKIILNNQQLQALMLAYQRRVVLKVLTEIGGPAGWSLNDIDYVLDLAMMTGSAKYINFPKVVLVSKQYDELIFSHQRPEAQPFVYEITIPGEILIDETGELFSFTIISGEDPQESGVAAYLDYDKLEMPLYLRSRRDGDRFEPAYMGGSKKLKDYFIDIKLPAVRRDRVPILASRHQIYALLGYRLGRNALVDADTRNILMVKREERKNSDPGSMGVTKIEKDYPLC